MIRRGEVRWYKFSRPDKQRPVLILTRDSHLSYLNEVTVVPITTTIRDIPTQVVLTKADGMPRNCAISLDHLRTVDQHKIGGLISTVSSRVLAEVRTALLYALGY